MKAAILEKQGEPLVIGDSPTFLICGDRFTFLVNNYAEPYVENLDAVGEQIEDLRLRKAVRNHRAWISVDLVSVERVRGGEDDQRATTTDDLFAELAQPVFPNHSTFV